MDDPNTGLPYTNPNAYQNGTDPLRQLWRPGHAQRRAALRRHQFAGNRAPPTPNGVDQNLWSGTTVQLDTGDASNAPISTQPDGLDTYRVVAGPGLDLAGDDNNETGGVAINAATFGPGNRNRNLYVVGDAMQDPTDVPYPNDVADGAANYHLQNLLYVESEDGIAHDPKGVINDDSARLPTQIIPLGQLQTGSTIQGVPATQQGADILDGTQFAITDNSTPANTVTFEMDSGPDMDLGTYGSLGVRSGQQFTLTDAAGATRTFEFVSGPVLIFHNDSNGSLNQATFSITDDKGVTQTFEFIEGGTQAATGDTGVTIPANASAQLVADLAVAAVNGSQFDTKAALGEYGDAKDDVDPRTGSTWARVSLILDSEAIPPTFGNAGTGGGTSLIQVEGSYNQLNNGAIPIYYKETYNDPTFLAIEQAVPATPLSPTEITEGFPWAATFGAQIQAVVQANMPGITVGYSPAAVAGTAGGDTDMRINFYGAVNTGFTNTGTGVANFGQATALVHDPANANADFNIRAVDVGANYNGVVVQIVTGSALNVTFAPGGGNIGGTLSITVTPTTTATQVVTAINALAQVNGSIFPFTASLDGSREIGGTNNGSGIVKPNATAATTGGGFNNGIMTWTDANFIPGTKTPDTNQVEDYRTAQSSPWGSVWTRRQGVRPPGGPGRSLWSPERHGRSVPNQHQLPRSLRGRRHGGHHCARDRHRHQPRQQAGLFAVTAVPYFSEVDLTNGSSTIQPTANSPLKIDGAGPGGDVTGLAYESIDGADYYFAVSNNGGVYEIADIELAGIRAICPIGATAPQGTLNDLEFSWRRAESHISRHHYRCRGAECRLPRSYRRPAGRRERRLFQYALRHGRRRHVVCLAPDASIPPRFVGGRSPNLRGQRHEHRPTGLAGARGWPSPRWTKPLACHRRPRKR